MYPYVQEKGRAKGSPARHPKGAPADPAALLLTHSSKPVLVAATQLVGQVPKVKTKKFLIPTTL